jgi:8-oxo-dGTP diphosphatase
MEKKIIEKFGNRLRVRVCGILIEHDRLLLVRHRGIGKNEVLWAPPGGGMNFGDSAEVNLVREFKEETGLNIKIERFLFTYEFLQPPLHAIELFFKVKRISGILRKGFDPEMNMDEQIIEQISFMEIDQVRKIQSGSLHYVLRRIRNFNDLLSLKGLVKFDDFA